MCSIHETGQHMLSSAQSASMRTGWTHPWLAEHQAQRRGYKLGVAPISTRLSTMCYELTMTPPPTRNVIVLILLAIFLWWLHS